MVWAWTHDRAAMTFIFLRPSPFREQSSALPLKLGSLLELSDASRFFCCTLLRRDRGKQGQDIAMECFEDDHSFPMSLDRVHIGDRSVEEGQDDQKTAETSGTCKGLN